MDETMKDISSVDSFHAMPIKAGETEIKLFFLQIARVDIKPCSWLIRKTVNINSAELLTSSYLALANLSDTPTSSYLSLIKTSHVYF